MGGWGWGLLNLVVQFLLPTIIKRSLSPFSTPPWGTFSNLIIHPMAWVLDFQINFMSLRKFVLIWQTLVLGDWRPIFEWYGTQVLASHSSSNNKTFVVIFCILMRTNTASFLPSQELYKVNAQELYTHHFVGTYTTSQDFVLWKIITYWEFCLILVALNVHWICTKLVNNFIPLYLMLGLKDDWK